MVHGSIMRCRQVKPPEENGLTLPHKTFAVFTYFRNIHDS